MLSYDYDKQSPTQDARGRLGSRARRVTDLSMVMDNISPQLLIFSSLLLVGCTQGEAEKNADIKTMHTIYIGQSPDEYISNNGLDRDKISNLQPAGLNFFQSRWQPGNLQMVQVGTGDQKIEIPHSMSILATEDADDARSGLYSIQVNAQLSEAEVILHNDALSYIQEILKRLTENNWISFIDYAHPRLKGEHAARYYQESDGGITFPADYTPSLTEWMEKDLPSWELFSEDTFLKISLIRDPKKLALDAPGDYLISYTFQSKEKFALSYFDFEERPKWKKLWKDTIGELKKERLRLERELSQRDYDINTAYADPIIHPADPIEAK